MEYNNIFDYFAAYMEEPNDGPLHVAARQEAEEEEAKRVLERNQGKIDGISRDNLLDSAWNAFYAAKKKDVATVTFDLMYPFKDCVLTSHEYILAVVARLVNLDFALWYVAALGAPTVAALFLGTALKPFHAVAIESSST